MSSVLTEEVFLTQPNYYRVGPSPSEIDIPTIVVTNLTATNETVVNLTVTGSFTGVGIVNSVNAGTGISITGTSSNPVVNIANTAVTPGSYTNASITVDQQGRITAASNGAGGVSSVSAGTGISVTGTGSNPIVNISNTTVTGGTYSAPSVTFNAQGQATAASNILTTRGDLLYVDAASTITRLPVGGANTFLNTNGTDPSYNALNVGNSLTGNGISSSLNVNQTSQGLSIRQIQNIGNAANVQILGNSLSVGTWNNVSTAAWNSATGFYTVQTGYDGWYIATCCIQYATNATGYREVFIQFDVTSAASHGAVFTTVPAYTGANNTIVSVSASQKMAAGDQISFFGNQNSGGTLNSNVITMTINYLGV